MYLVTTTVYLNMAKTYLVNIRYKQSHQYFQIVTFISIKHEKCHYDERKVRMRFQKSP